MKPDKPFASGHIIRLQDVIKSINRSPSTFLLHPVHREMKDEARTLIRSLMRKEMRKSDFSPSSYASGSIYRSQEMDGRPVPLRNRNKLDLVAPLSGGGLGHWRHTIHDKGPHWLGPLAFGSGKWDELSLIRSSYGNLEFIVRKADRLIHFWRDKADGLNWRIGRQFANGVSGAPFFMQSSDGNFEVIAPLEKGGIGHWWRNNNDPGLTWHGPSLIGGGKADAVALMNTNDGHLVAVVKKDGSLLTYTRDRSGTWHLSGRHE